MASRSAGRNRGRLEDAGQEATNVEATVSTQTLFNQGDLHGTYDATGSIRNAPIWADSSGLAAERLLPAITYVNLTTA